MYMGVECGTKHSYTEGSLSLDDERTVRDKVIDSSMTRFRGRSRLWEYLSVKSKDKKEVIRRVLERS